MAEFSNYLENKLLDHVLKNISYTSPSTVYVALYTSNPGDDNSGTEVSGGSYSRQSLSVTTASAGASISSGDVTFPQATAGWGTITHVGLFDAITSGNLLMYTALNTARSIETNDILKFNSGNITVSLD